ncbi:MAG: PIN domain-containing protein [Dysgonamonadaceae bacterium]|jgi:predicted nucleic acid-binding protein|nr:PIN domain-containing protein [Dysgonamonadaceae bacterium]
MNRRIFVDSNVWVYLFAKDDNSKSGIAASYLAENRRNSVLVVSYQVLNEVCNVLKKKQFSEPGLKMVIEYFSQLCVIQDYSTAIALLACDLREQYSLSFWDSHIVASALTAKCQILASEDMNDNQLINQVRIKNIFNKI